jgi:hypothetical protein
VKSTIEYLRRHRALFTFGENIGRKIFRCRYMASTGCRPGSRRHRSLEDGPFAFSRGSVHNNRQLVHKRSERYYVARQKISVEQIARISAVHFGAKRSRRNIRDGDQYRRYKHAQKI